MKVTATDSPSASRIGVQRFRADRNRNQLERAPGADFRETIHGSGPAGTDAEGALNGVRSDERVGARPPASLAAGTAGGATRHRKLRKKKNRKRKSKLMKISMLRDLCL